MLGTQPEVLIGKKVKVKKVKWPHILGALNNDRYLQGARANH